MNSQIVKFYRGASMASANNKYPKVGGTWFSTGTAVKYLKRIRQRTELLMPTFVYSCSLGVMLRKSEAMNLQYFSYL